MVDGDLNPGLSDFKELFHHARLEFPSLSCTPRASSQIPLMGKSLPRRLRGRIKAPVPDRAALYLVFLASCCSYTIMAIPQLLSEYKLRAKWYFLNKSQCFAHSLSGVARGPTTGIRITWGLG